MLSCTIISDSHVVPTFIVWPWEHYTYHSTQHTNKSIIRRKDEKLNKNINMVRFSAFGIALIPRSEPSISTVSSGTNAYRSCIRWPHSHRYRVDKVMKRIHCRSEIILFIVLNHILSAERTHILARKQIEHRAQSGCHMMLNLQIDPSDHHRDRIVDHIHPIRPRHALFHLNIAMIREHATCSASKVKSSFAECTSCFNTRSWSTHKPAPLPTFHSPQCR